MKTIQLNTNMFTSEHCCLAFSPLWKYFFRFVSCVGVDCSTSELLWLSDLLLPDWLTHYEPSPPANRPTLDSSPLGQWPQFARWPPHAPAPGPTCSHKPFLPSVCEHTWPALGLNCARICIKWRRSGDSAARLTVVLFWGVAAPQESPKNPMWR